MCHYLERRQTEEERTSLLIRMKKLFGTCAINVSRLEYFSFTMAISLSVLILFTSLSYTTETVIVKQSSLDVYLQLEAQ
jgi:hypothetical protein